MSEIILPFGKPNQNATIERARTISDVAKVQHQIEQAKHGHVTKNSTTAKAEQVISDNHIIIEPNDSLQLRLDDILLKQSNELRDRGKRNKFDKLYTQLESTLVGRNSRKSYYDIDAEYRINHDISVDESMDFITFCDRLTDYVLFLEDKVNGRKIDDKRKALQYGALLCLNGSGLDADIDLCFYRAAKVYNSMHETLDFIKTGHKHNGDMEATEKLFNDKLGQDQEKRILFVRYVLNIHGINERFSNDKILERGLNIVTSIVHIKERSRESVRRTVYR